MKIQILSICLLLALIAGTVDAAFAYEESIFGDLSDDQLAPDFVETNPALRNDIVGTVGGSDVDRSDTLWFFVPAGCRLVEVELERYSAAGGNVTTYFALYSGSGGTAGAFITGQGLGEADVGSGILARAGLPSQTSDSYSIWIDESTAGQSYTLRIHLEAYRWDEETMGSSGLNGDWNDERPTGYPWLPISVRGSQIRGTVGGTSGNPSDNFTDGIQFRIPQGYELVDITLREYITVGGNHSTSLWVLKPGETVGNSVFYKPMNAGDLGVNILGTQRIGPGTWNLIVYELTPGQTYSLYLRMAPEAWNEAIHGELPNVASAQNISFVGGHVEWSGFADNSGNDLDAVRFTVPTGWSLERFILIDYVQTSGSTESAFNVYDDTPTIGTTYLMHEGLVGDDLMGPVALGPGTYRVEVHEVSAGTTYTVRAELGRVIYKEWFHGDLSNIPDSPTPITISSSATGQFNDIVGDIGDSLIDWDDYAVFTLAVPKVITEFTVLEYDPVGQDSSTQFRIYKGVGDTGPIVINGEPVRPGMVGVNLIDNERAGAILPPETYTISIKEMAAIGNSYAVRLTSDLSYFFADGFESGSSAGWDGTSP